MFKSRIAPLAASAVAALAMSSAIAASPGAPPGTLIVTAGDVNPISLNTAQAAPNPDRPVTLEQCVAWIRLHARSPDVAPASTVARLCAGMCKVDGRPALPPTSRWRDLDPLWLGLG